MDKVQEHHLYISYLYKNMWKRIENSNFEITHTGIIRNIRTNHIRKPYKGEYLTINLTINKQIVSISIHRLIAMNFIPNPDNLPCVNHKDGNKYNNSLENLEWCTFADNINHAIKNGKINKSGINAGNVKLNEEKVKEILQLRISSSLTIKEIAKEYQVSISTIKDLLQGRTWSYLTRS